MEKLISIFFLLEVLIEETRLRRSLIMPEC